MGNVYMEADQIRYKGQYRTVQEALDNGGGGGGGTTVVANPEGAATADLSKLQVGTTIYGIPADAADISYNNTTSGMTADDVQDAIDELNASIPGLATTSAPGIVQPDGTTITIIDGVISAIGGSGSGVAYSTTETQIGTWNGAPLYGRIVDLGNLPNNSVKEVLISSESTLTVRRISGIVTPDNNELYALPYMNMRAGTVYAVLAYGKTGNKIALNSNFDASTWTGYAIVEYTKTA